MRDIYRIFIVLLMAIGQMSFLSAQQLAFPGAQGYGKYTTGGRGGEVIKVTNLNDAGNGSLREAVNASGARTIVFTVSGTIHLETDLEVSNGDLTIAGQTAPGDGICVASQNFSVDADNVIIRFMRFRLGDLTQQGDDDSFSCGGAEDVIIDHCSFSWGIDEVASMYNHNYNTTMQWCMVTEGLNESYHQEGGDFQEHGYGGIWGGVSVSFHHNIIAHHKSRFPRMNGARYNSDYHPLVDYRNNVLYNWRDNNVYGGEPSDADGSKAKINIANNYYKAGPATGDRDQIVQIDDNDDGIYSDWYVGGNYVYGYSDVTSDNTEGIDGVYGDDQDQVLATDPFDYDETLDHTALEAFAHALANTGCVLPYRDPVDQRIVEEIISGTATYGNGIIDSQEEVGGWPELESEISPKDSDNDGMPDEWEKEHGFDHNDYSDGKDDADEDEYTNLEEYLNTLAAQYTYIVSPVNFAATEEESGVHLSWEDVADKEKGFIIERAVGEGVFTELTTTKADVAEYTDEDAETEGKYYYRVRTYNDQDTSLYSNVDSVSITTSINSFAENEMNLSIHPNPFNDHFYIEFELNTSQKVNISFYDISGMLIKKPETRVFQPGSHRMLWNIGKDMAPGMYFINISTNSRQVTQKIIKK